MSSLVLKGHTFLHSGLCVPFANLKPEHIVVEDIIHHLSLINRWHGATSIPFSVLEHSLYCADLVASLPEHVSDISHEWRIKRYGLLMLLHDAEEYITGDIPSPLKDASPGIREVAKQVSRVVFKALGVKPANKEEGKVVHRIDMMARLGEAREFLPHSMYVALRMMAKSEGIKTPSPQYIPDVFQPDLELARRTFRVALATALEPEDE